ncbi:MAG: quinone oxidoreductase [Rhizobiaceae bacterium]
MTHAIEVTEHGGSDVLAWVEKPVGTPGPNQVRIKSTAVGLNFIDVYFRTGLYPSETPFIPGKEGAGIVMELGEGVTNVAVGDRVAYCNLMGTYAEEVIANSELLAKLPDGISDEIAASIMLKGLTAHYLLCLTYPLKKGETILFHAAAGGVGLIACQWAKQIGATVIGTVGSPEKAELAKANGCDHTILYRDEDFVERVKEITGGKGVDVVYDSIGKDTFEKSLDCLKKRGMMVSFGNATGPVAIPNLGVLAAKGALYVCRPTLFTYIDTPEAFAENCDVLFGMVESGKINITIGQKFALKDAAKAHDALEGRATVGSTLLIP